MITVDNFAIDVAIKITPSFKAKATTHPIENGATGSDHLIDDPDTLTIECIVSDNPIGEMVKIRDAEPGIPSERALQKFLALKVSKSIFSVVTDHRVYSNMVLLEFTPTFDKETGESLRFTLQFQQLVLIQNDRQFVATPIASAQNNRGNKAAKKPPDTPADTKADRNTSILHRLLN